MDANTELHKRISDIDIFYMVGFFNHLYYIVAGCFANVMFYHIKERKCDSWIYYSYSISHDK